MIEIADRRASENVGFPYKTSLHSLLHSAIFTL